MAKITLYHGGYMPIEKPEIRISRNTKDFGPGFYCTTIKEQARRWAKRYDNKIVSIYEVRMNPSLAIKEFKEMTEEWLFKYPTHQMNFCTPQALACLEYRGCEVVR